MNYLIIGIIVANLVFTVKGFNDNLFFNKYKFQVGRILQGEKIRMLTSGFLHVDWTHLIFNMYALYLFGSVVVSLGNFTFLVIYFVSLLAGSMYSLYINKDKEFYSAVGASGAVSGILFSAILLAPNMSLYMIPIPIPIKAYIFGIGYLLYSIYGMKKQLGNVGHSAHLGGAIAGYISTLIVKPSVVQNHQIMVITMGVIIFGLLFFGDKLKFSK